MALVVARGGDIKLESLWWFPFQPHLPFQLPELIEDKVIPLQLEVNTHAVD